MRRSTIAVLVSLCAPALGAQLPPRPGSDPATIPPLIQSSLVFARDNTLLGEIGREFRTPVSIRSLPKYLPQAFVAVEDKRFYQHDGVDLVGIAGALKDAAMGDPRGASTITQQVVGNLHPDVVSRADKTMSRKLREQQAAREMEKRYSKEQILEAYINQIHFGHGWYGIDAAARHYFGKDASRVTLAEAAALAAMPKGPAIYDPIRYPERVKQRRDLVLELMAQQGYVARREADAAKRQPIATASSQGAPAGARYAVDVVRVQAERAGVAIGQGGFRVFTTIDPALQTAAQQSLTQGILDVEAREGFAHRKCGREPQKADDCLQGMVVAIDPGSGDIRALVGGRDYASSPFNRAVNAMRQPGSAFKPVVYAAAIADSLPANAIVMDTALAIPLQNGTIYRPANADNEFLGPLTLREALVRSRNPVAVQLFLQLGADTVQSFAQRMGIDAPITPYPSSAIGASVVQPLDLVRAYAVFATLGTAVEPRIVLRVEDNDGRTVWTPSRQPPQHALDAGVAFIVRDMMEDVVERGTATSVRRFVPERVPVAGKTGTTNDNSDVWFVGLMPELVAGVWLGFDRPRTITPGAAGGTLAAPVFGRMVAQYYGGRQAATWQVPEDLVVAEVDRLTGALADSTTPPERRQVEYFLPGTEPPLLRYNPWRLLQFGPIAY
jgi:penicillin-binding protein 1A